MRLGPHKMDRVLREVWNETEERYDDMNISPFTRHFTDSVYHTSSVLYDPLCILTARKHTTVLRRRPKTCNELHCGISPFNRSDTAASLPSTVRKLNQPWVKIDQLDVACFIVSLFTAQHVSNVSTSIFMSLRLIVVLFHVLYCSGSMCVGVTVWFGWGSVVSLCRLKLLQQRPTWCHLLYYFTIYCSTCSEC